eukprot:109229_1
MFHNIHFQFSVLGVTTCFQDSAVPRLTSSLVMGYCFVNLDRMKFQSTPYTKYHAMFARQQPLSPAVHLAQTMTLRNADREKFDQLFRLLDTEKNGVLPGSIIFPVFTSDYSKLPKQKLSEIWSISDWGASPGGVSHEDFYVGLRLIAIAQKGYPITRESVPRISDVMGGTDNLSSAKATASNDLLDMDLLSAGPASTGRPTDSANDFFVGISSGGSQGGEGGPTSTGKPDHTDMFSGIGGAGSASALGTSSGPGSVAGLMRSDFFGAISSPPSNKGGLDTDITRRSQKSIRHICDVVG